MTPKEKAKQLIDKFYVFQEQDAEWCMLNNARVEAIVCVDEIILALEDVESLDNSEACNYWKKVLTELQKRID